MPAQPFPSAPTPGATRPLASGPAGRVFAADLRRSAPEPGVAVAGPVATPIETVRPEAAAASAPPIDMLHEGWPSAMVDRIERLRDAADAADTRVRLVPDALGAVEVRVRREGDAVHVHFDAERAATRQLLQEAAPRLAEAAEARGLRLGQTGVGDGGSQPGGRQHQQSAAPAPARPRPASAAADDAPDTRIA